MAAQVFFAGLVQWKIWRKKLAVSPSIFVLAANHGHQQQQQHYQNLETSLMDQGTLLLLAVALAMYMVIVKIAPHSGGTSLILAMVRGAGCGHGNSGIATLGLREEATSAPGAQKRASCKSCCPVALTIFFNTGIALQ